MRSVRHRVTELEESRPDRTVRVVYMEETPQQALARVQKEHPGVNVRLASHIVRLSRPIYSVDEWQARVNEWRRE